MTLRDKLVFLRHFVSIPRSQSSQQKKRYMRILVAGAPRCEYSKRSTQFSLTKTMNANVLTLKK